VNIAEMLAVMGDAPAPAPVQKAVRGGPTSGIVQGIQAREDAALQDEKARQADEMRRIQAEYRARRAQMVR
jgi:hypothetical protein